MAQVKLKIEVNPNAETEKIGDITNKVNDVGSKSNLSNVSIKAKDNGMFIVKEMNNNGRELLSFGESGSLKFTQDGYLTSNGIIKGELASEQNPDMFVWGVVPSNKKYSVKLTFTNAQNLKDIVVYGDKVSNQFPIEAIIDNKKVIYSNDYRWAINLGVESDTHTIEFTKWNRGDYNACLTLIRVMLRYFEISNSSGLIELESLSQSNTQPKDIYYGLIPNTGSAIVNDNYGEINDLINEEIITNSMNNIEIYIDNKKVQHHITTDSDYEDGKRFSMEFENSLSFLETKYSGRNLTNPMKAYDLLKEVLLTLNYTSEQIDNMLDKQIIYGNNEVGSVKSYLEKIIIEYPYLESATYRETLNKFCTLAQLNLLEDDNGNLKFVSARPVEVKDTQVIVIPTNRQFSKLTKDEFLKNKYQKPYVSYCKFTGEENLFGDTISVSYLEDTGIINDDYMTVIGKSTFATPITFYYETAKDKNKNALYETTYTGSSGYKTSVSIKIPKEVIIKDILSIKLSLNGSKAGTNTVFYTDFDNNQKSFSYLPYKTTSFSALLDMLNVNLNIDGFSISNVYRSKEQVKFDILFRKPPTKIVSSYNNGYDVSYFLSGTMQLYGKVYQYDFVDNNQESDLLIEGNELIQEGTLYEGQKINELNQTNIIVDYTKGIKTANISVACLDYYDTNGNKAIDWSKQEIMQVGQVVRIDKDNLGNSKVNYINGEPYLWKITGRRFRYSGVPMLDLELQEVKLNTYFMIVEQLPEYVVANYTRISSEYGGSIGQIRKTDILYPNDVIKVDYTMVDNPIYDLGNAYVNGNQISSGDTITINDNLNLSIETSVKTFKMTSIIGNGATLIIERESSPYGNAGLGSVDTNETFYYGDVLFIDWSLENDYKIDTATINGNSLSLVNRYQYKVESNMQINITTKKMGWQVAWEGTLSKNFLESNLTESETIMEIPSLELNVNMRTRFYFDYVEVEYGSDLNNIDSLVGNGGIYEGFYRIIGESESISGEQTNLQGRFNPPPYIHFNLMDTGNETTNFIKINRSIGVFTPSNSETTYQCVFSKFRITKIEQYVET